MGIPFIKYRSGAGLQPILSIGVVGKLSDLPLRAEAGESVLEGTADRVTQVVDADVPEVVDRSAMGAIIDKTTLVADSLDEATISGVPVETTATARRGGRSEARVAVDDGVLILTFDTPGTWAVELSNPVTLPQEFAIVAS